MVINNLFYFAVIGLTMVAAQGDFNLDQLKQLDPNVPETFNEDQLKELSNKTSEAFREKCLKNGGPDSYKKAEEASKVFLGCIQGLVDQQVLQKEIEEAKPHGRIDEVFKKYCAKSPQFKDCLNDMMDAVKPCFAAEEQKHLKTMHNITENLMEFVCFKDGDRIALFISEDGPECLQKNNVAIQQCINSTLGEQYKFNPNELAIQNIPTINFDDKTCGQLFTLQKCVVQILESCPQPTTANIVEALFKFARKATPCAKIPTPEEVKSTSGASTLTAAAATILATGLAARLV